MLKVVATDGLDTEAAELLKKESQIGLTVHKAVEAKDLVKTLEDCDLVVIRSATQLNAQVLGALSQLKGVLRAGVGVDNIDLKFCEANGIQVWNAPTGNFQSTAELALAHIFALFRKIPQATEKARKNEWGKKELSAAGQQIQGSTLGIYGVGNIGLRLAKMASSLGMKVIVSDPFYKGSDYENLSKDELLARSLVISIHAPLLESTRAAFNSEAFAKMKKGSFIVNCARGGIVAEKDLLHALQSGQLGGAALDVFEKEPFDTKDPVIAELLNHPNFICTPHIGASTQQAQKAVGMECAEKIISISKALQTKAALPPTLIKVQNSRWE